MYRLAPPIVRIRPRRPPPRDRVVTGLCGHCLGVALAATLALWPGCAGADPGGVRLLVDRDIGGALGQAIETVSASAPVLRIEAATDAACAGAPAATPRLAVLARLPRSHAIEDCEQRAAADVAAMVIGYAAVAVVAPARSPSFVLRSADLFNAVATHGRAFTPPATWNDLDARLPAQPIGLLAPPPGSAARRLLDTYVMEPACSELPGGGLPFDYAVRLEYCAALRDVPAITARARGIRDLADWAAAAPAGQLAVVTLAELRQLDGAVVPLPLDGALPTAANIETGLYRAAEPIALLMVVPRDTGTAERDAARRLAFDLLAELSIGPEGSLTEAGLVPLPPADRIGARARAIALVEHP